MTDSLTYFRKILENVSLSPPLSDGDGDSLSNDIALQATEQSLVLNVTEEQYVKLLSAALNGANVTYPAEYIAVIYPLIKAGKLSFCEQVESCIETNEAVQQAIASLYNISNISSDTVYNTTIAATNTLAGVSGCDNDNVFGACTGVVDFIDSVIQQLLTSVANEANASGRLGQAISAIPGLEKFPVDEALIWVESFLDDVITNYDSYYTLSLRDDYRCGLFCIARDDCELSLEDIHLFFVNELGFSITEATFEDFFDFFLTGGFSTVQFVHAMFIFVSGIILFGGRILDLDSDRMVLMVSALFNDPDGDWSTLCTDCDYTWESILDFTVDDYGFAFQLDDSSNPIGEWVDGVGLRPTCVVIGGQTKTQIYGWISLDDTTATYLAVTGVFKEGAGQSDGLSANIGTFYDSAVPATYIGYSYTYAHYPTGVATPFVYSNTGEIAEANRFLISFRPSNTACYVSENIITQAVLRGKGTKPSQLP